MAQLELTKQAALLAHINFAANSKENDDKTIPTIVKFEVSAHNGWLANFHPRLAGALYMADDSIEQLPGVSEPDERTKRVFGDLFESLKLKTKLDGATGTIFYGIKDSEIPIELATVKDFTVSILEGGTIKVVFNVHARFTSTQIKTLTELMESEVKLSIGMVQGELIDD